MLVDDNFLSLLAIGGSITQLLLLEVEDLLGLLGRQVGLPQVDHLL